jgi:hypothetical protein
MNRNLVLALLAANLLYWSWSHWVGDNRTELQAVATTPRKPKPKIPLLPPAPPPCATIGPFDDELSAIAAEQQLVKAGWGTLRREAKQEAPEGWWVTVSNTSPAAQTRTLNTIRRAGISDAFAMPDDAEFRVSVGIFSEEDRAEDRATKVQQLKLDAVVAPRMRDAVAIWFDVPGVARETLSDGRLAAAGLDLARLRIEGCPETVKDAAVATPEATAIIPSP